MEPVLFIYFLHKMSILKDKTMTGPLSNITIIDLSTFLAGPFCSQILADMGARVIKVERPEGDFSRSVPPHFIKDSSLYYHSINRNKESIVIDLKQEGGKDLIFDLVKKADVVLENFRPGVME